jgi:hypothetical protein
MRRQFLEELATYKLDEEELDVTGAPTGRLSWDMAEVLPEGHTVYFRTNDSAQAILNDVILEARVELARMSAPLVAVALMDGLHQDQPDALEESYYDRAYAVSDSGFPGVWQLCLDAAEIGVDLYGKAWQSGAREFVDDIQNIMPLLFDGEELTKSFADHAKESWKKILIS